MLLDCSAKHDDPEMKNHIMLAVKGNAPFIVSHWARFEMIMGARHVRTFMKATIELQHVWMTAEAKL